jgi:hypothetical protein
MIRVTPLVSTDIVGRYSKGKGCIVDTFMNKVFPTKNRRIQNKVFNKLNTVGLVNSNRLQQGLVLKTVAIA